MTSLRTYRALVDDWSQRTLAELQRRFDAYASPCRAQIERSLGSVGGEPGAGEEAIRRDLEALQAL